MARKTRWTQDIRSYDAERCATKYIEINSRDVTGISKEKELRGTEIEIKKRKNKIKMLFLELLSLFGNCFLSTTAAYCDWMIILYAFVCRYSLCSRDVIKIFISYAYGVAFEMTAKRRHANDVVVVVAAADNASFYRPAREFTVTFSMKQFPSLPLPPLFVNIITFVLP